MGQRSVSEDGDACGQDVLHPLVLDAVEQPLTRAFHDEHRRHSHGQSVCRLVGHDLHATILAAAGIDHERLTFKFQGLDQRLTGVENPQVVTQVFA